MMDGAAGVAGRTPGPISPLHFRVCEWLRVLAALEAVAILPDAGPDAVDRE